MSCPHPCKTIWLSDIHLGTKDCKAELLLDFLNQHQPEILYLVGDIVDMWQMHKQFRWPKSHNEVLHKIFTLSNEGCQVIYLPGNHDEPLQRYDGMVFDGINVCRQHIHKAHNGKQYLVLHGDQFDEEVCLGKFETWLGDKLYTLLLILNRWYNHVQEKRQKRYFSLSGFIKSKISGANKAISRYRIATTKCAQELGLDGVICGHIHHPEKTIENGIEYINDGDWVDSCSALVEEQNGDMDIVYWHVEKVPSTFPLKATDIPQSFEASQQIASKLVNTNVARTETHIENNKQREEAA